MTKEKKKTRLQTLLSASKETLRFLLRDHTTEEQKQQIVELLTKAIETAEGPEHAENVSSITLVMTHATYEVISTMLADRDDGSKEYALFLDWIQAGLRETKQRIYIRLGIDHSLMRQLKMLLLTTTTKHSDKAFKRLAEQIEAEGLSKNPLEVLAELGL